MVRMTFDAAQLQQGRRNHENNAKRYHRGRWRAGRCLRHARGGEVGPAGDPGRATRLARRPIDGAGRAARRASLGRRWRRLAKLRGLPRGHPRLLLQALSGHRGGACPQAVQSGHGQCVHPLPRTEGRGTGDRRLVGALRERRPCDRAAAACRHGRPCGSRSDRGALGERPGRRFDARARSAAVCQRKPAICWNWRTSNM